MPLFSKWNIMLVGWLPLKKTPLSERQAFCIVTIDNTLAKYTSTTGVKYSKKFSH
jgi:hypothetical protein